MRGLFTAVSISYSPITSCIPSNVQWGLARLDIELSLVFLLSTTAVYRSHYPRMFCAIIPYELLGYVMTLPIILSRLKSSRILLRLFSSSCASHSTSSSLRPLLSLPLAVIRFSSDRTPKTVGVRTFEATKLNDSCPLCHPRQIGNPCPHYGHLRSAQSHPSTRRHQPRW